MRISMAGRPNMGDVARRAGVSAATVSRVARGSLSVTDDLRERVRASAASLRVDLDGRPGANLIMFLLANRPMLHPIHSRILGGAESYCAERGWDVLFQSYRYGLKEK